MFDGKHKYFCFGFFRIRENPTIEFHLLGLNVAFAEEANKHLSERSFTIPNVNTTCVCTT